MRGFNLHQQPDSVKKNPEPPFYGEVPEEELRLAGYIMQARLYLITHHELIKLKYANYVFEELCKQNSRMNEYYHLEKSKIISFGVANEAIKLIKEYILFCGEMLVLCNPEKEPCVVVDAYAFTDFDIEAFEEQMLTEYIQNNSYTESVPYSAFVKKAAVRMAKFGGGYAMSKAGTFLTKTGDRLSLLSKHYASGHKMTMRIQKSFRGKKAQQEALLKLMNKSAKYGKSAAKSTVTGTVLKKSAAKLTKGAFRPVSIFDTFFNVPNAGVEDEFGYQKEAEYFISTELMIYCERNNNYKTIINQQYFIAVDE
jgi:hypothetical protein